MHFTVDSSTDFSPVLSKLGSISTKLAPTFDLAYGDAVITPSSDDRWSQRGKQQRIAGIRQF